MEFVDDEPPHQLEAQGEGERGQPLEREVTGRGRVVAVNLNNINFDGLRVRFNELASLNALSLFFMISFKL